MGDPYWRFVDGKQQPPAVLPHMAKRPRSNFETPSGHDLPGYYARENEMAGHQITRDTDSVNASYERYLRSAQISSYGGDPRGVAVGGSDQVGAEISRSVVMGARPELQLPHDATSTLFVEGLPADCTRREVSHIFRPFLGYKEVRLVDKPQSRHVLCFVDFLSPAHAATAMDALQGYKFDEHDRESSNINLQFARNPGARSGGGRRGRN
ncbi:hypothetical protein ABFS82_06G018100 [Erythranthe guttata]|uniref:RRM domain-containing protein n=1 Tax=Erythranthe guttata TaxID=4155 RepID=A0A022S1Z1_ERYGU|nr:PREDICTED: uncharacterized protein LOC105963312 isoform X1 [Erythranthe guttata]EYU45285.1 hypothetical protein MIMGU_mgv1a013839mg [Erythranthe guttata]|eukprot:XP_012843161.1 PREDICTED: uncharacterized protein LOC105963312 isoform X1 [Erythranthe guttata]